MQPKTQTLLKHAKRLSVTTGVLGVILALGTAGASDLGEIEWRTLVAHLAAETMLILLSFVCTVYIEYIQAESLTRAEYKKQSQDQIFAIDYQKMFEEADEVVIPEEI